MPPDNFPCPACEQAIAFPLGGEEIATCSRCGKTWKAGPYFQEGFRMALANEGQVELTLWHKRIDGLLASLLGFMVGLTKGILMVLALLLFVLLSLGVPLNWPLWTFFLVSGYAVLEWFGRCLPKWLPKNFAATPTAVICWWGLVNLESQHKPMMIPWISVTKVTYFSATGHAHVAVDYRNNVGGSSTLILQEDSKMSLASLYDSICARIQGAG